MIEFPSSAVFNSKLVLSPVQSETQARVFAWSCMSGQEIFVGEITATADRSRTITNNKIVTGHGQSGVVEGMGPNGYC